MRQEQDNRVTYHGSCHCQRIRFEVHKSEPIAVLADCDCSLCRRQGFIHTPVEDAELEILCGEQDLSLYQFGSGVAKYWFCPTCGCSPFDRSRTRPERYSVNVRCLDEFDEIVSATEIWFVDGRNHPIDNGSDQWTLRPNPYRSNNGPRPPGIAGES